MVSVADGAVGMPMGRLGREGLGTSWGLVWEGSFWEGCLTARWRMRLVIAAMYRDDEAESWGEGGACSDWRLG